MKNNLVLFTSYFPYKGGEQFLETEIKYLSNYFEKIYIIPSTSSSELRSVPHNINIINDIVKTPRSLLFRLINTMIDPIFYKGLSFNYNEIKYHLIQSYYIRRNMMVIDRLIKDNIIDINKTIFYSYWFKEAATALSLCKNRHQNLKFITRAHGSDLYENINKIDKFPFREMVLGNIDAVYGVSLAGQTHLKKKYPAYENKILASYLGVEKRKSLSHHSNDGIIRIVSCSNLIPLKRINLLIDALSYFDKESIYIIWTHIGDGILRKKLEKHCQEKLITTVSFKFIGSIENSSVIEFYQENPVDIFINVSESEGIPVSIMEAQSFGIPVIATDVGGVSEIINDDNGVLLDKNTDSLKIYSAIKTLSQSNDFFTSKRINSIKNWDSNYNAEKNYHNFIQKIFQ